VDAVADRLLATLRQLAPHKVRVYDNSDEHRDVAVPQRRKRWTQVITTIEGRPWVRCELLDKSGSVLGYVDNEGPAGELEDLATGGPNGSLRERQLLELMIKAQSVALTFRDKEHSALLEGMRDMMAVHAQSTRELIEIFRVQRDVAAETAAMAAQAEAGGDAAAIVKLIEGSPALQQVLAPVIARLLQAGQKRPQKPAAPANGVKS